MQIELEQVLKIFDDERNKLNQKMNSLYNEGQNESIEFCSLMNAWSYLSVIRNTVVNKFNQEE